MAYGSNPQDVQNIPRENRPISRWLPIGFLITAIVFFAVGGGLLGAYTSSISTNCGFGYSGYGYYNATCGLGNIGLWDGGIACIAIAAFFKLLFWISLIMYCVRRRRYLQYTSNPYPMQSAYAVPSSYGYTTKAPDASQNVPPSSMPAPQPAANNFTPTPQELSSDKRFCGQCGTAANNASFCTQCGARI